MSCFGRFRLSKTAIEPNVQQKTTQARLKSFISVSTKQNLQQLSEIGWINKSQLILTLNNDYYLINLQQKDLIKVKNSIIYGRQQVNMNLFCSITQKSTRKLKSEAMDSHMSQAKINQKISSEMTESQQCIQRMEIASLKKFVFLNNAKNSHDK